MDIPGATASLLRLSVPDRSDADKAVAKRIGFTPEPTYGTQLQIFATGGLKPEGRVQLDYDYRSLKLADGTSVELRKPPYQHHRSGPG